MTLVSTVQVAFELWGCLFCLIVAFAVYLIRDVRAKGTRNLMYLLLNHAVLLLCDAIAWIYRGNTTQVGYYAVRISNFLFFELGYLNLFFYTGYLAASVTEKKGIAKGYQYAVRAVYLVGAVSMLLVVINLFNHMYYSFDATNHYYREKWYWLSQVCGIVAMLIDFAVLVRYRKRLKKLNFWALMSYILLPVAAMIILIFFYGISLLNLAITIAMLFMFVSLLVEQTNKLAQRERELTDMHVNIMLSQIQPHFLYNSLNAIYHLCGKDTEAARQAISNFSDYLRGNLDSLKHNTPVPFETELKHVRVYLSLEKMRYDDDLEICYDIETTSFRVPALTVQPLVENAVRHGLGRKVSGGKITISTREFPDRYEIQVADDGIGFDANEIPDDGRSHTGIENVRFRLQSMCRGTLTVVGVHGVGTVATIGIPKSRNSKDIW